MKKIRNAVCTLLIVAFIFTGSVGAAAADYGAYFDAMLQFMKGMLNKEVTDEEGLKAALKGMFEGLDKYSSFYDNEETKVVNSSLGGNFVGIGAGLEKSGNFVKITKVYDQSPAEKAGIQESDLIIAIDGKSIENMDAESVAAIVRGEAGTTVKITVMRDNIQKEFNVVRGTVIISPVLYHIEDNMAYIRIDGFVSGTALKFYQAMEAVNKHNITKIILDLRGNTGGYVDEAVNVARKLMPPGIVTTLDYKSEEMLDRTYTTEAKNPDYVIAVLVDQNTASASEILAGALEDSGVGILIGQKTYGKGVFQNIFSVLTPEAFEKYSEEYGVGFVTDYQWMSNFGVFPEKDEIFGTVKLTTGHYLTPNGRSIDGIGLEPLMKVPNRTKPNGVDLSLIGSIKNSGVMQIDLYSSEVYNAESILKAAGFFTEVPDKKYDSETADAVKKYQEKAKLPQTGMIDEKTRDHMNKTLHELRSKNDPQYAKAEEVLRWFAK